MFAVTDIQSGTFSFCIGGVLCLLFSITSYPLILQPEDYVKVSFLDIYHVVARSFKAE